MMDKEELISALEDLGMFVTPAQADAVLRKFGGGAPELNREQFNLLVDELRQVQANLTPRSAAKMSGTDRRGSSSGLGPFLPVWKHHDAALRVYTNKWMQSASSPFAGASRTRRARPRRGRQPAPNRSLPAPSHAPIFMPSHP